MGVVDLQKLDLNMTKILEVVEAKKH